MIQDIENKKIKGVLREKELKGEYLGSIAPYGYKKVYRGKAKKIGYIDCSLARNISLYLKNFPKKSP